MLRLNFIIFLLLSNFSIVLNAGAIQCKAEFLKDTSQQDYPVALPALSTIGPGSKGLYQEGSSSILVTMIEQGTSAVRVNTSHIEDAAAVTQEIEYVNEQILLSNTPTGILIDTPGIKMRVTGKGQALAMTQEQVYSLVAASSGGPLGGGSKVPVPDETFQRILSEVQSGNRIRFDDGKIEAVIESVSTDTISFRYKGSKVATLIPNKGINLPDTNFNGSTLTSKDKEFIEASVKSGHVSYIAISFVLNPETMLEARELVAQLQKKYHPNSPMPLLVAKIESPLAMEKLEDIVKASDLVMYARGDYGAESDEPAYWRKAAVDIRRMCYKHGKGYISATGKLESTQVDEIPNRTEVSDLSLDVRDRASAQMMSQETAMFDEERHSRDPVDIVAFQRLTALIQQRMLEKGEEAYTPVRGDSTVYAKVMTGFHDSFEHREFPKVNLFRSNVQSDLTQLYRLPADEMAVFLTSDPMLARQASLIYGVFGVVTEDELDDKEAFAPIYERLIQLRNSRKGKDD